MDISTEAISVIIGVTALIGGGFAWWFAKVLSERKEDITQTITLGHMADNIKEMRDDIRWLKSQVQKIAIIEEKLKHFKQT